MTFKQGCGATLATVAGIVLIIAGVLFAAGVRLFSTDVNRVVTQHTLEYVQTHQKMALDFYADWQQAPDAGHKAAAVTQACAEAALLTPDEWPAQAVPFLSTNCR